MNKSSSARQNWLLAIAVMALAVIPLIFVREEYGGADGQAKEAITEIHPTYEPWFQPFFEPSSGEIERLLLFLS